MGMEPHDAHPAPRPRSRSRGRPRPPLTAARIRRWAEAHRRRTGDWPSQKDGPVGGAGGETWHAIDEALRRGLRGLPGGDSLARLLRRECGAPERHGQPPRADPGEAARLRAEGLTLAEIGRRLGVSRQWVSRLLRKGEGAGKRP
jgi:hypothetical protein